MYNNNIYYSKYKLCTEILFQNHKNSIAEYVWRSWPPDFD